MNLNQKKRQGMVLLIVLGMLGLFSLLAVTYLVYSGQSRTSGLIINRAKLTNPGKLLYDPNIILQILRGNSDTQSAFAGHSLLGDIYGRRAIEGNVRRYIAGTNYTNGNWRNYSSPQFNVWNALPALPHGAILVGSNTIDRTSYVGSDLPFCKIPLDVSCSIDGDVQRLNHIDDSYNARIFTMLEGPLSGYSFRVLKYIGEEGRTVTGTEPPLPTAPTFDLPDPADPLSYSILINLQELPVDAVLEGEISDVMAPPAAPTKLRGSLADFLFKSPNTLFYKPNGEGYKFLINDAVYNGLGYGLNPADGNLTQQVPFNPVTNAAFTRLPAYTSLLPNYDYLQYVPNTRIGGSTNEGYDVADYRDYWLSHTNPNADTIYTPSEIIPSYHRPELVNYIWRTYASNLTALSSLSVLELREMLVQIDWACARPLPIGLVGLGVPLDQPVSIVPGRPSNHNFSAGRIPPLTINLDAWPSDAPRLYGLLEKLIGWNDDNGDGLPDAVWDVDNDGDGRPDSVWVDAGLPPITAPNGKLLKAMAAVHIIDLDSRINLNLAGDMYQGYDALDPYITSLATQDFNKQSVDRRVGRFFTTDSLPYPYLSQGLGVGPAEIQFGHLFQKADNTNYPNRYLDQRGFVRDLMRARNGADSGLLLPDPFRFTGYPGRSFARINFTLFDGNDMASKDMQTVQDDSVYMWASDTAGNNPATRGMSPITRGKASLTLDRNGNPLVVQPNMIDANGNSAFPEGDINNDAYELSQDPQPEDAPFTLEELERVIRRFDGDIDNLSKRLSSLLEKETTPPFTPGRYNLMSEINNVITTRSHELRNLPIGFPGRDQLNYSSDPGEEPVGDMLKWIALLHEQHYRYTEPITPPPNSDPNAVETTANNNDPSAIKSKNFRYQIPALSPDILRALFPIEFRYGLRMDINRPFGNGVDNDTNGVVDEPSELGIRFGDPAYFYERGPAWTAYNPNRATPPARQDPLYVNGTYNQHGYDENRGAYRIYPDDGVRRLPGTTQTDLTLPSLATRNNAGRDLSSRQLYARQLYCLAQLLVPTDYQLPLMRDLPPGTINRAWYKRRAKVLAQWAVNVVDFRDSDAVMTRFSYDYLPFGVGAHNSMTPKEPGWTPEAGDVVWGMEYPELLLTETLAFHDKRVRTRTQLNPPNPTPQVTPVQFRIPQGSLFIELFNTRTPASLDSREVPALPKELYQHDSATGISYLQLSKLAPASTFDTRYGQQPVWRIGITPQKGVPGAPLSTQDQLLNQPSGPVNATPLPMNQVSEVGTALNSEVPTGRNVNFLEMNGLMDDITTISDASGRIPAPANQIQFERMVWFTNQAPTMNRIPNLIDQGNSASLKNRVFYNRINTANSQLSAMLPVGSYSLIAPRMNTYIGSKVTTRTEADPYHEPSTQRISVNPANNLIESTRIDSAVIVNSKFAPAIRPAKVIIAQADPPSTAWVGPGPDEPLKDDLYGGAPPRVPEGIGLNVSEPLPVSGQYYLRPSNRVNSNDSAAANPPTTPGGFATMRPDGYANFGGGATRGENDIFDDQQQMYVNPILSSVNLVHGTHNDFRQVYLQRLADPMQGYDPVWNPYITIDVMPVDLTLYTGENGEQKYDEASTAQISERPYAFESRFKDGRSLQERVNFPTAVDNAAPLPAGSMVPPVASNAGTGATFTTKSYFSALTSRLYVTPENTNAPGTGAVYFKREIGYHNPMLTTYTTSSATLGYLNVGHQIAPDATAFVDPATSDFSPKGLYFDGFGPPLRDATLPNYSGSPNPTYYNIAGLFWPNRLFANASEITQVPFTPPGMLGAQFTNGLGFTSTAPDVAVFDNSLPLKFASAFGHLFNFFDFENVPTTSTGPIGPVTDGSKIAVPRREPFWMRSTVSPSVRSGLGYLLELIETAPLYKETARVIDPRATDLEATDTTSGSLGDSYAGPFGDSGSYVDSIRQRMLADYKFPHNKQWTYTNPGKININTISDERVFRGLEALSDTDPSVHIAATATNHATVVPHPTYSPTFWNDFRQHLRGFIYDTSYQPTTKPVNQANSLNIQPNLDNRIPSQFVGAFQSPFNAAITPPVAAGNMNLFRTSMPATTTLRRPYNMANPITPPSNSNPLMSPNRIPDREYSAMPFSLYQRFSRLTNLVTNQSNVFAVWITVGLFEWDPINGLSKEYVGTDGKTDRTRSFYIIDRTVPVAYREGNTFNAENAILLRRNISRKY